MPPRTRKTAPSTPSPRKTAARKATATAKPAETKVTELEAQLKIARDALSGINLRKLRGDDATRAKVKALRDESAGLLECTVADLLGKVETLLKGIDELLADLSQG